MIQKTAACKSIAGSGPWNGLYINQFSTIALTVSITSTTSERSTKAND